MSFKTLKKIVGIFGFKLIEKNLVKNEKLIGSNSILNTKFFLQKIFSSQNIQYLMQIGANDGIRFDELNHFIKNNNPKSILIEPIKSYFDQLLINYAGYKNVFLENSAIGDNNSVGYLYKVSNFYLEKYDEHILGINSFNKNHLIKHNVKSSHIEKEKVNFVTTEYLFKKYNITKLDLLVIDAEGYDGNILINFLNNCDLKPIIIFEYIHIDYRVFKILIEKLNNKKFFYFKINENLICLPEDKINLIL